jgi:voltage-gated potassium channel
MSSRTAIYALMHERGATLGSRLLAAVPHAACTTGLLAVIAHTGIDAGSRADLVLSAIVATVWGLYCAAYALQIWLAPEAPGRRAVSAAGARLGYMLSTSGWIDLMAVLALPAGWLTGLPQRDAQLFAVVWALKYIRQSSSLAVLLRVLRRAAPALVGLVTGFFVVLLIAATLAYLFEREAQPEAFRSIPRALWWGIVTLSTTGYGDVVPLTIGGRMLAAGVMVSGIVIFALWAGIIASAFAEELQRRHFLRTWDLVAEVPFFQSLGAAAIADIVRLLHPRHVAAGTVVIREGQAGDSMYFIVSGEATVMFAHEPVKLGAGAFFGEMALLFGTRRSATVVITEPGVLLALDIADFRVLAGKRPELINVIEAEGRRRRGANATPRPA